jgi:hypothetical protein
MSGLCGEEQTTLSPQQESEYRMVFVVWPWSYLEHTRLGVAQCKVLPGERRQCPYSSRGRPTLHLASLALSILWTLTLPPFFLLFVV